MPWNAERIALVFEKEILKGAAGLDDIKTLVMDSTAVDEHDPSGSGRYVVEAGTVLAYSAGPGSKVIPVYDGDSVSEADVAGILGATTEFWIGGGVDASEATDEPIPGYHHGCHFDTAKLVGYTGNETEVEAALKTCIFS